MAYTAWVNRATGYVALATDWNIIGANFAAGVPDLFTTKGDLAVATAADTAARLGVGANGTVLTAASGEATGLSWAAPLSDTVDAKGDILVATGADALARLAVGTNGKILTAASGEDTGLSWAGGTNSWARYTQDSAQTFTSAAAAAIINFETITFDSDTAVTTGAAWKYTVPAAKDGYYLVCATVNCQSSAAWGVNETAYLQLYKNNGADSVLCALYCQAAGTYSISLSGATLVSLVATDYIDVRLYQNSGSNLLTDGNVNYNHIAIARLF